MPNPAEMPDRPGRHHKGSRNGNHRKGTIMRNRFKRASYAVAAGVTVAATIGLSAVAASASPAKQKPDATTACGASCTDINFLNPGSAAILGVHSGLQQPNNIVRLLQGSNGASKEDFTLVALSTVAPLYCTVTGQAQPGSVFTSRHCALLRNAGLLGRTTFQIAFNPNNGGPKTLCIGSWDNEPPVSGFKTRLEPCGVAGDTVMIATPTLPTGTTAGASVWLVNGASDNFSNPLVMTSTGNFPSQPTWNTVIVNGNKGVDTQEVRGTPGPF